MFCTGEVGGGSYYNRTQNLSRAALENAVLMHVLRRSQLAHCRPILLNPDLLSQSPQDKLVLDCVQNRETSTE